MHGEVGHNCFIIGNSRRATIRDVSVGKLMVTVVEAADLIASDINGLSDPFCVIQVGENQELATPVILRTLNPHWNHVVWDSDNCDCSNLILSSLSSMFLIQMKQT